MLRTHSLYLLHLRRCRYVWCDWGVQNVCLIERVPCLTHRLRPRDISVMLIPWICANSFSTLKTLTCYLLHSLYIVIFSFLSPLKWRFPQAPYKVPDYKPLRTAREYLPLCTWAAVLLDVWLCSSLGPRGGLQGYSSLSGYLSLSQCCHIIGAYSNLWICLISTL